MFLVAVFGEFRSMPKIPDRLKKKSVKPKPPPHKKHPWRSNNDIFKGKAKTELPLDQRLANAADQEAMRAMDLIEFPDLLKKHKLPEVIAHGIAHRADELNRESMAQLRKKYNA